MHVTVEDVDAVRFALTRGPGYSPLEVDELLDQVRLALEEGHTADGFTARDLVLHATLPVVRRRGYDSAQVDDFLERISGEPRIGITPGSSNMQPLPEEAGLFARLFGRR